MLLQLVAWEVCGWRSCSHWCSPNAPHLSTREKQIGKDEVVHCHASGFNASCLFWCTSFLLLEYTKQTNALMSSHVYSTLSGIFEATVMLTDKTSPNFEHNASRHNCLFCQVSSKSITRIFGMLCICRSRVKKRKRYVAILFHVIFNMYPILKNDNTFKQQKALTWRQASDESACFLLSFFCND